MKKRSCKYLIILVLFLGMNANVSAAGLADSTTKSGLKTLLYGLASFYNRSLQGFLTSSGEHYNGSRLTAAHKSLPMGTMVRVTDLRSKCSVIVRINDRLPKSSKRLIDVSKTAADALHLLTRGLAKVSLEVLHPQTLGTIAIH